MAKFVCDFEQVNYCSKNILSNSDNIRNCVNNMDANVKENLPGWTGTAHDEFIASMEKKKEELVNYADLAKNLSEFLSLTAESIMSLEEELSSLSI